MHSKQNVHPAVLHCCHGACRWISKVYIGVHPLNLNRALVYEQKDWRPMQSPMCRFVPSEASDRLNTEAFLTLTSLGSR